jgi:hypothetical protein
MLIAVLAISGLTARPASANFRCAVTWIGEPATYGEYAGGACNVGTSAKSYAKVEISGTNHRVGMKECAKVENTAVEGASWRDFECLLGTGTLAYIWVSRTIPSVFEPDTSAKFTSTSTKATVLKSGSNEIKCGKSEGSGSITGETTASLTLKFKECSGSVSGKKCPSEISTVALSGVLGGVLSEESSTETAIQLSGSKAVFMEPTCESSTFKVEGSVAGEVSPVKIRGKEGKFVFSPSGSGEKITKIAVGGEEKHPELKLLGTKASFESTDISKYEDTLEVT